MPVKQTLTDQHVPVKIWKNRQSMLELVLAALQRHLPPFTVTTEAVNCHHNYVAKEHHFGEDVWVTREGAIRAQAGDLGIVPGSMGARSFIVQGLGNPESFCSSKWYASRARRFWCAAVFVYRCGQGLNQACHHAHPIIATAVVNTQGS